MSTLTQEQKKARMQNLVNLAIEYIFSAQKMMVKAQETMQLIPLQERELDNLKIDRIKRNIGHILEAIGKPSE